MIWRKQHANKSESAQGVKVPKTHHRPNETRVRSVFLGTVESSAEGRANRVVSQHSLEEERETSNPLNEVLVEEDKRHLSPPPDGRLE